MWNTIVNWWYDRKFGQGKFYEFTDHLEKFYPGEPNLPLCIRILQGKFKGVVFYYVKVNVERMTYSVKVVDGKDKFKYPANRSENFYGDNDFVDVTRNILTNVMRNMGKNNTQVGIKPGEEYEDDGEIGTEEPVAERTIRSKGPSLP